MTKIKIVDALMGDWPGFVGAVFTVKEMSETGYVVTTNGKHFVKDEYEIVSEQEAV